MKKAKKKSRVEVYGGGTFMFVGIPNSINAQSHPDPHPRKKIFLSFFLSFFLSLLVGLRAWKTMRIFRTTTTKVWRKGMEL